MPPPCVWLQQAFHKHAHIRIVFVFVFVFVIVGPCRSNVWQEQMGFEGGEIFRHIYATPSDTLRFMRGMHSFAALSAKAVMSAFDLSRVSLAVLQMGVAAHGQLQPDLW